MTILSLFFKPIDKSLEKKNSQMYKKCVAGAKIETDQIRSTKLKIISIQWSYWIDLFVKTSAVRNILGSYPKLKCLKIDSRQLILLYYVLRCFLNRCLSHRLFTKMEIVKI